MSNLANAVDSEYDGRRMTRSVHRALQVNSEGSTASAITSTASALTSGGLTVPDRLAVARLPALNQRRPVQTHVKGFIYSAGSSVPRSSMFNLKTGVTFDFGGRTIPDVHVTKVFRISANATVYHSFVTYNGRTFLVYGFNLPTFPLNGAVMALKKTTEWRGDVIVFCVGLSKPLLKSPPFKKEIIDTIVCIFVSRVTEYRDLGLRAPFMIEA